MPEVEVDESNRDLPLEFRDRIVSDIGRFTVAVFGITKNKNDETIRFCGCGTLVSAGESSYILTAAHVWAKVKRFDQIILPLKKHSGHFFRMDREAAFADACLSPDDENWGPWGPDLCFLRILPVHVGTINAYLSFYNLTKRREAILSLMPEMEKGTWVVFGGPSEIGRFTDKKAELQFAGYFSRIQPTYQMRGEFDYLDVGAKLSSLNVPSDFAGMSGGGLWQVFFSRSEATDEYSIESINLEGVVFYQTDVADHRRIIRCHGRHSIYRNMPSQERTVPENGIPLEGKVM